jgi:hypothetical protein
MFDKLNTLERRHEELMTLLANPAIQAEPAEYRKHAKALSEVQPLVDRFTEYKQIVKDVAQTEELTKGGDSDMRELAHEELRALTARRDALIAEIKVLLVPKDPNDEKNVVLEIRAGTGGEEAALFAGELFRMYNKFAERQGWRLDVLSTSEAGAGGLKEVIALIEGRAVYDRDKQSALREVETAREGEGADREPTLLPRSRSAELQETLAKPGRHDCDLTRAENAGLDLVPGKDPIAQIDDRHPVFDVQIHPGELEIVGQQVIEYLPGELLRCRRKLWVPADVYVDSLRGQGVEKAAA